jgi:DNA-binding MarR family transcriptional regulator
LKKALPHDDAVLEESLFKAAESKALTSRRLGKVLALWGPAVGTADKRHLSSIAKRELRRRAVRERYLPADLVSELGWLILLDLFASENECSMIRLIDISERWEMSRESSARHTALLIGLGLAVRVFDEVASDPVTLRLTAVGHHVVSQVLHALDESDLPLTDY